MLGALYYEFYYGTQVPGYLVVIMLWGIDAGDKFKGSFMVSGVHLHRWTLLNDSQIQEMQS